MTDKSKHIQRRGRIARRPLVKTDVNILTEGLGVVDKQQTHSALKITEDAGFNGYMLEDSNENYIGQINNRKDAEFIARTWSSHYRLLEYSQQYLEILTTKMALAKTMSRAESLKLSKIISQIRDVIAEAEVK